MTMAICDVCVRCFCVLCDVVDVASCFVVLRGVVWLYRVVLCVRVSFLH